MVAFLMMGILALLGFLCISPAIPGIARSESTPTRRKRRATAQRPRPWGSSKLVSAAGKQRIAG